MLNATFWVIFKHCAAAQYVLTSFDVEFSSPLTSKGNNFIVRNWKGSYIAKALRFCRSVFSWLFIIDDHRFLPHHPVAAILDIALLSHKSSHPMLFYKELKKALTPLLWVGLLSTSSSIFIPFSRSQAWKWSKLVKLGIRALLCYNVAAKIDK